MELQTDTAHAADQPSLSARMAGDQDGILEQIAREYGVSTFEVVSSLPPELRTIVSGEHFVDVLNDVAEWGEILFIVHTPDIVLECHGTLPTGSFKHGYYNVHGDSAIGGHIRASNCKHIAFLSRPFMGRPSLSLNFFNEAGAAMFKIFVRRNTGRELIPEQCGKFAALRSRFQTTM